MPRKQDGKGISFCVPHFFSHLFLFITAACCNEIESPRIVVKVNVLGRGKTGASALKRRPRVLGFAFRAVCASS